MSILTEDCRSLPQFFQQNGILPTLYQITSFRIFCNSSFTIPPLTLQSLSLGFEPQWEQEIFSFTPVQTSPGVKQASHTMDTGTVS
jgi:hypothetical protein